MPYFINFSRKNNFCLTDKVKGFRSLILFHGSGQNHITLKTAESDNISQLEWLQFLSKGHPLGKVGRRVKDIEKSQSMESFI